jgi:hypothetical protein
VYSKAIRYSREPGGSNVNILSIEVENTEGLQPIEKCLPVFKRVFVDRIRDEFEYGESLPFNFTNDL